MSILDALLKKDLLTKKEAVSVSEEMRLSGESMEQVLKKHGVSEENLLMAKGEDLGVPTRSIKDQAIPFEILKYIPEESAKHYRFIPVAVKSGVLEVGMVDPDDIEARDALNFISSRINMPFKAYLITESDFDQAIELYKGLSGEVTKALSELETDIADVGGGEDGGDAPEKPSNAKTIIIPADLPAAIRGMLGKG